ncbi:MAG: DUF2459 domain-containing protein [Bacteroidales bacterium]
MDSITVYVAKHDWHTAIIIEKAELAPLFPELTGKFPDAHYLDISWGDKKYFMALNRIRNHISFQIAREIGTFCLPVLF